MPSSDLKDAQRWKTSLMNCCTYPGADCDTDHQLLVATLKVRLGKRQRQDSIPPLNLEELKEDKAVQFAAEVTNRFTPLKAAQNEVNPEDLWKGTKTVLLEVTRETIGCVKSQKKKKWIYDATYAAIKEKREAKGKDKKWYQELKAEIQRKLRVDKQQQIAIRSLHITQASRSLDRRCRCRCRWCNLLQLLLLLLL